MLGYVTFCVNSDAESITAMVDAAIDIKPGTFFRHVSRAEIQELFGYAAGNLRIEDDYHVSYHRSKYRGERCYFMVHSATEYVWQ